jgi:hypothetical protein
VARKCAFNPPKYVFVPPSPKRFMDKVTLPPNQILPTPAIEQFCFFSCVYPGLQALHSSTTHGVGLRRCPRAPTRNTRPRLAVLRRGPESPSSASQGYPRVVHTVSSPSEGVARVRLPGRRSPTYGHHPVDLRPPTMDTSSEHLLCKLLPRHRISGSIPGPPSSTAVPSPTSRRLPSSGWGCEWRIQGVAPWARRLRKPRQRDGPAHP